MVVGLWLCVAMVFGVLCVLMIDGDEGLMMEGLIDSTRQDGLFIPALDLYKTALRRQSYAKCVFTSDDLSPAYSQSSIVGAMSPLVVVRRNRVLAHILSRPAYSAFLI